MAVVTSSVPEHCHMALEALDLEKYFERITFAQELGLEKRRPDVWLAAAKAAGVRPEDCTVFDDSLAACQGASMTRCSPTTRPRCGTTATYISRASRSCSSRKGSRRSAPARAPAGRGGGGEDRGWRRGWTRAL